MAWIRASVAYFGNYRETFVSSARPEVFGPATQKGFLPLTGLLSLPHQRYASRSNGHTVSTSTPNAKDAHFAPEHRRAVRAQRRQYRQGRESRREPVRTWTCIVTDGRVLRRSARRIQRLQLRVQPTPGVCAR